MTRPLGPVAEIRDAGHGLTGHGLRTAGHAAGRAVTSKPSADERVT